MMKLSDFDYHLPSELIAANPPEDRTSARLLYVDRNTGEFSHQTFSDVLNYLQAGDLLVLNNTKVLPARIFGQKSTGGRVEALLLKDQGDRIWETLLRPGGRIKKGAVLSFGENGVRLQAEVLDDGRPNSGMRSLKLLDEDSLEKLKQIGHVPLPPYIDRPDTPLDRELYQTVFASKEGAVASPTAGLHFDQLLLDNLKRKGVEIAFVTLHVSYGTFQPVDCEDLSKHEMFEEEYEVEDEAAEQINRALSEKRRIIACGTTSVRTLESVARKNHEGTIQVHSGRGQTRLFIYPPYEFKIVQGLITNFHLPKSTLLLLVSAIISPEGLFRVYEEAIREKYRFYSYGDAMIIL